jgi:hypothetical protein
VIRAAGAVARHPSLWITGARQLVRVAPDRWWARAPFLPIPSQRYLRFRLVTQYGDTSHRVDPADVVNYLRWCRDWQRHER